MREVTQVTGQARPPPREEHSTLWVPEQRTWALSPKHSAPTLLVLLHLQPLLPLGLRMLSVTVAGPCRLAWIGAGGVTAWGSNFTQSDFTPQQFLTAVFSIFKVDKIRSSLITQSSREGLQKRRSKLLGVQTPVRKAMQGLEVAYRGR